MISRRGLIMLLVLQSSLQAAAGSAGLAEIFPRGVVAGVGLLSAMLSSGTAALVAATRGLAAPRVAALDAAVALVDDGAPRSSPPPGR